jgi:hypothetical protein
VGLGLLEHNGEVETLVRHLGQDVVGGPVHDSEEGEDAVGDQPFLDRPDQRNAAGDSSLEGQGDAAAAGLLVELGAVVG